MEIYLIRHGQTDFNKVGIVQGQGVNSKLNALGRRQANQFFQAYHHIPFNLIFTSELQRTLQSVEPFLKTGFPHKIHAGLNEINWGKFEGKKPSESQRNAFKALVANWKNGQYSAKIADGESAIEMWNRQKKFIADLIKEEKQKILICSHGRAIRALLCQMLGLPLSKMDTFNHSNLCLYRLGYNSGKFSLLHANLTDHLRMD